MSVKFTKRLSAYIIDFMIFMLVTSLVTFILPRSAKLVELGEDLTALQDLYINQEISAKEYIDKYQEIIPLYDKENLSTNICDLVFILGYFVIIPVLNNGQTLGQKLRKIKVVKRNGKLTIIDMLIRSFIITSLLQITISTFCAFFITAPIYFNIVSTVSFLQILLVITTAFMILCRKDKKGIQDLITKTSVVEV